jgi:hypothetical protein
LSQANARIEERKLNARLKDVLPRIGGMFAGKVTRINVTTILDEIVQRGSRRIANRILTDLFRRDKMPKLSGIYNRRILAASSDRYRTQLLRIDEI